MRVYINFRENTNQGPVFDYIRQSIKLFIFQSLEHLQADADKQGNLEWGVHYVDGTVIRANLHAAGGKKGANHRRN